ncbi:hypothetical protein [Haloarchaeobius sp. HRN-SO-5]|uniref:hypothetical protein n=1 Tax=Haloarchaeobius sp. HRN-SO-5 TaxID=3446118 RepID=UPI003EBD9E29
MNVLLRRSRGGTQKAVCSLSGALVGGVTTVLVVGWFAVRNYPVWDGSGQFPGGPLVGVLDYSLAGIAIVLTPYLVGLRMLGRAVGGYVARVTEQH